MVNLTTILRSNTVQKILDKMFHYRWIGILAYALILLTFVWILSPYNDSWWETLTDRSFIALMLGGFVVLVVVIGYFIAAIIRTISKRQFAWLIAMLVVWPLTIFYLLFANTDRAANL